MPFELNRTVAAHVAKADEDVAYQEFQSIQSKLATLIKRYPHTNAGKAAADMVDRADLRVGPKGYEGLYPINTFFSGAAINR